MLGHQTLRQRSIDSTLIYTSNRLVTHGSYMTPVVY